MFMEECKHPESSFKTYFCWQLWGRLQVTHCSIPAHSQPFRFLHNTEPRSHRRDLSTSGYSSPATRRRHFDCPIAQVKKKAEHLDIFSEERKEEQLQLSPPLPRATRKMLLKSQLPPSRGKKNKYMEKKQQREGGTGMLSGTCHTAHAGRCLQEWFLDWKIPPEGTNDTGLSDWKVQ